MSDAAAGSPAHVERTPDDRLDSWKEIAAYLRRDVTTVQRWEKREGMPVHRHVHDRIGSVYAFKTDLDLWSRGRNPGGPSVGVQAQRQGPEDRSDDGAAEVEAVAPALAALPAVPRRRPTGWLLIAAGAGLVVSLVLWRVWPRDSRPEDLLSRARFLQLTDFDGTEQAAALSRDGRFVAFLSDRDGRMDVWVTQLGTGQFHNLTRDAPQRELVNPSLRTLGFSPEGTDVTFWTRRSDGPRPSDIGLWAVPILGGQPRPYLDGVAEFDSSGEGGRLVYHTTDPGDPMFVRDPGQSVEGHRIYAAPPGLHGHFPTWSPDGAFIYFVQGTLPDHLDIWRIKPAGGTPERMTHHESLVSHPVFLDARTLLYLASDPDGSGPWLHSLDVERRTSRRISVGIDRYTSLAGSADGRRLVATLATPKSTLWRMPLTDAPADNSAGRRIALTTSSGSSPRLGAGYLLYVSSKGTSDSIWKLQGDRPTELWNAPEARIIGGPAIAKDGSRIAFSIRRHEQTLLYVANADGTDARIVTAALALQGAPAWRPDGQAITVSALADGAARLFNVTLDGRPPTPFVQEYSVDPAWSPDGDVVMFSGPDIGTTFPVKAVTAGAGTSGLPTLTLTRGARRLVFMPGRRSVVMLRGEIRHKNLWAIDLDTGAERQLTNLAADFAVRDFDLSPDGREVVLEQVQEQSNIVLLDLPRR